METLAFWVYPSELFPMKHSGEPAPETEVLMDRGMLLSIANDRELCREFQEFLLTEEIFPVRGTAWGGRGGYGGFFINKDLDRIATFFVKHGWDLSNNG